MEKRKALHLLEMGQLKVLLPYFISSHSIKALAISFNKSVAKENKVKHFFTNVSIKHSIITSMCHRPVITKLVHEGIQHRWGAMSINTIVAIPLKYDAITQENSKNMKLLLDEHRTIERYLQGIAKGKSASYKVICFLYVREYTTSYSDHPEELIDIVT